MGGKKIITRTILLVSLVSLFTDIASEMLYPVMPVYLKSIGFSVLLIGVLEGLAEATAGISKGYFGRLSDLAGKRVTFIRWGYALSAFSKPMMAVITAPWWIFLARTTDRLGKGIRTSARDALLSDESSPETRGKVFGFHRALDTLGAALGPAAALMLLLAFPERYRLIFLLAFIPGLLAILLTFLLKERTGTGNAPYGAGFFSFLTYWKRAGTGYKRLLTCLLAFALLNSSDVFLLLMVKEKTGSDVVMISVYIAYNLLYALFSYPVGIWADKTGIKTVLVFGMLLFSVTYFFFGFATDLFSFGLLFVLYALYAASAEGMAKAYITRLARPGETATAIGFYNSLSSVAALLSSTLAGIVWVVFSPQILFTATGAGVMIIAAALMFLRLENKSPAGGLSSVTP